MNLEPMAVQNYNLEKGCFGKINTYLPPEHIPQSFYDEIVEWFKGVDSLNNLFTSISTEEGFLTMTIHRGHNINLGGLGILEIELRGAMGDFDPDGLDYCILHTDYHLVLHASNGVLAYPIDVTSFASKDTIDEVFEGVKNKLSRYFDKLLLIDNKLTKSVRSVCIPKRDYFFE